MVSLIMKDFNAFQTLSVVGLIFSFAVQMILILVGKKVDHVWALYPTWVLVFCFGYLLKKFSKEEDYH